MHFLSIKKNPKGILKVIKYCTEFLNKDKISLWLFPQGVIMPPNHRPLEFKTGLGSIAKKVKKVNLFPIAIQYVFLRQGLPEVLIDIGKPILVDGDVDKNEFTAFLEEDFTRVLDNQLKEISNGEIDKYNTIMYKKWDGLGKHIEKWVRNRI